MTHFHYADNFEVLKFRLTQNFKQLRKIRYLRNHFLDLKELELEENHQNKIKNISNLFYEGLGNIFW